MTRIYFGYILRIICVNVLLLMTTGQDQAPSLGNTNLSRLSNTSSSVTIGWSVPDLGSELRNRVIYLPEIKTSTEEQFHQRNDLEVSHSDVEGGQAQVIIDRLIPETLYVIQIVPYVVDLQNSKRERGIPSKQLEAYIWNLPPLSPPGDGLSQDLPPGSKGEDPGGVVAASGDQTRLLAPDNSGLIAGIVVGGMLVIALVIIGAMLVIRRMHGPAGSPGMEKNKRRVSRSKIQVMHDPEAAMQKLGMANVSPPHAEKKQAPKPPPVASRPVTPTYEPPRPISVSKLHEYIAEEKKKDTPFQAEYTAIPNGDRYPCERGSLQDNYKIKNRFLNIIPYDRTRVELELEDDDPLSDYINASYLTGYKDKEKAYVACQGPRPATLADMWRLIWQLQTNRVVMVTKEFENGRRKCERYWPEQVGQSLRYGKINVAYVRCEEYAEYVIRVFSVTKQDSPARTVRQFHYTSWPDKRPPMYAFPLLAFQRKLKSYDDTAHGPLLVHCSAGVGRTGTFLALDYLLQQAAAEQEVNVAGLVDRMRAERVNMIQTLDQYIFVYDALLEAITQGDTSIPASRFTETFQELIKVPDGGTESRLAQQFHHLEEFTPNNSTETCTTALQPENIDKNRDIDIVARDNLRPFLHTQVAEHRTDYINAVYVDSYRSSQALMATHMPLPHTVVDLWRMIMENSCNTLVMLNEYNVMEEDSIAYWPLDGSNPLRFGSLEVREIEVTEEETVTVRDVMISYSGQDMVKVRLFQAVESSTPLTRDPSVICDLIQRVEKWQQAAGQAKIAVHCIDGVTRTGLFCAAVHLLDKLRVEQEVDIFTAVKHVKVSRYQFISTMEQYLFLHQLAEYYISLFDTYSNFKVATCEML